MKFASITELYQSLILSLSQADFSFGIKDFFDILLITSLFYIVFLLIKRTHSTFIVTGATIFGLIYVIAKVFNLYITRVFFQTIFPFFIFIIVVIFQREIRYFFEWLATWRSLSFLKQKSSLAENTINDILAAVQKFKETKTGALIVFPGRQSIDQFVHGGTGLFGRISFPLLLSIFDDSTPGHDGAIIIKDNRIEKFGVRLPLSDRFKSEVMGTRHCAGVGISERSDAFTIVVSEERGIVSYTYKGVLTQTKEMIELKDALQGFLSDQIPDPTPRARWHSLLTKNVGLKIGAISLSTCIWFGFALSAQSGIINRQLVAQIEFKSVPKDYAVELITPKTISVTLAGKNPDFKLLKEDSVRAIIDIKNNQTEGTERLALLESMIDYPQELQIVSFEPHTVKYSIKKIEVKEKQ